MSVVRPDNSLLRKAIFQRGDGPGCAIGGEHDLFGGTVKGVESMEALLAVTLFCP